MNLNSIDRSTPEGRLLWAALIIMTTSPALTLAGQTINGRETEPDKMLELLDLAEKNGRLNVTEPDPDLMGALAEMEKRSKAATADDTPNLSPAMLHIMITDPKAETITLKLGITDERLQKIAANPEYGKAFDDYNLKKIGKAELLSIICKNLQTATEIAYVAYCAGAELESAPLRQTIVQLSAKLALLQSRTGGGGKGPNGGIILSSRFR